MPSVHEGPSLQEGPSHLPPYLAPQRHPQSLRQKHQGQLADQLDMEFSDTHTVSSNAPHTQVTAPVEQWNVQNAAVPSCSAVLWIEGWTLTD